MADWKGLLLGVALGALSCASLPAAADPWALTGDLALRHDLRLLADAGVVTAPANTWPIPWAAIAADLDSARNADVDDSAVAAARARMQSRVNRVRGLTGLQPNARLAARTDDFWLRTFEDTPRDGAEARIGVSWMGNRFAARAQVSYADDPLPDDEEWRGDGSYLAGTFGNHILSAGALDRWWGPSWDDTLILSSNARPVPALTLERNVAHAFESKWLSWIGPWRYTLVWGDLVIGNDNTGSGGIDKENEPGNQLAAADFRWRSPWMDGPWAIYGQAVGEDESGGLPSKFHGPAGLEFWGTLDSRLVSGRWRAHAEYTNTTVRFTKSNPEYDDPYNHSIYKTGYHYKRRGLGADGDSELISHEELEIVSGQLSHKRQIGYGSLDLGTLGLGLGVQYSDNTVTGASDTDPQDFVTWTWDYSGL